MSHLRIDSNKIINAKIDLAGKVASMYGEDILGLKNCKTSWGVIFATNLILDALTCVYTESVYTQKQVDCLQGKLSENLRQTCCK